METKQLYSKPQLQKYFERIDFPPSYQKLSTTDLTTDEQLQFLFRLQHHQLATIPFENLTLHYSWHRVIDVNADRLYEKIVVKRRGGYCMENNSFFHSVLVSLGFDAYMVAARVYNTVLAKYGGLTHCLNIVTVGGVRYAVDVCFGSRCPVHPLELRPEQIQTHSGIGDLRLNHSHIPQATRREQKYWIYEHRADHRKSWVPQYCFLDTELFLEDIFVMNLSPSRSPRSFFTYKVVCAMFTTEDMTDPNLKSGDACLHSSADSPEVGSSVNGVLIIHGNTFKWHKNGTQQWQKVFESEDERIDTIRRYFGISLTEEDQRAIRDTVAAVAV